MYKLLIGSFHVNAEHKCPAEEEGTEMRGQRAQHTRLRSTALVRR